MFNELCEIYDSFTTKLVNEGWKGKEYGWREISRGTVNGSGMNLFELDNGFNLMLTYSELQKQAHLSYWFHSEINAVDVKSLQQLLQLLD